MKARSLGQVDALGMLRLERATEQTLPQVVEILFERDFISIVDGPIEPLVLIVAAGGDPSPGELEVLFACEVVDLHSVVSSGLSKRAVCSLQHLSPPL